MNDALSFLGLLNRGGKTLIGETILYHLKEGEALVLAEADSSSAKRLEEKAIRAGVTILRGVSKSELGNALGYSELTAVYVKDRKASKALIAKWKKGEDE
ncbi:MAG: hypothetical protein SPG64_01670 [Candidatus Enteromonas sp.]|nr:hypothetical protein [Candidatus Enteromonas sp.]